jgi:hypothetical protein
MTSVPTMSNPKLTVSVPPPGGAKRVRLSDVERVESQVAALNAKIARLELKIAELSQEAGTLPMSREHFMALSMIATLQSGGWQQVKYLKQRAGMAYESWRDACEVPEVAAGFDVDAPEPAASV